MKTQDLVREVDAMADSINSQSSTISNLAETVSEQSGTISSLSESVNLQNTTINSISQTVSEQGTSISELSTEMETLQTPNYYGTTVAEINDLAKKCYDEPYINNGGDAWINYGTKGANGPKATIFLRLNPFGFSSFVGYLEFYLSNIPSGATTFKASIWFNDTKFVNGANFIRQTESYQMVYAFNYSIIYQTGVANKFVIEFEDATLADMVLDKIKIVVSSGRNFMVLNRDTTFDTCSFLYSSQSYVSYSKNDGNKFYTYNSHTLPSDPTFTQYDLNSYSSLNINYGKNYRRLYLPNGYNGVVYDTYNLLFNLGEDNQLHVLSTSQSYLINMNLSNVNDAHYNYFGDIASSSYIAVCGTLYTQKLFIGDQVFLSVNSPVKLNNVEMPLEFIQCVPIHDYRATYRKQGNFQIGYILLHNSGHILYINKKLATYFIDLGIGTNPTAYKNEDGTKIIVSYCYNSSIVKKELVYNANSQKYEIGDYSLILYANNYREVSLINYHKKTSIIWSSLCNM